jgi:hypothetical protein
MRILQQAIAVLVLALLVAGQAIAQAELKPGIGITFSDVSKNPANGQVTSRAGWQLGGSILIGQNFYGEGGLFYATKSMAFTSTSTKQEFTNDINGVRIPVVLGFHLIGNEKGLFALRVFGGGSAFIITSVNAPGASKDDFTSPTWGLFAGAGLDIFMFFIDLQYEWSLSDVSKLSTVDIGQSRSFIANAGIRLAF